MTETMTVSTPRNALISWIVDAIGTIAVVVLLISWLIDLQTPQQPSYLSKSFLQHGFCLSSPQIFEDTHFSCSLLDAFCGFLFIFSAVKGKMPSSSLGFASYFFAHAYGHHELSQKSNTREDEMIKPDEMITLACILAIGPWSSASFLVKSKKMSNTSANIFATVTLACLVSIYAFLIKNPKFGLLYINISITISALLPKMLLVGFRSEEDVALRTSGFHWASVASNLFVSCAVMCEPFFCDSFIKRIGGHFIFDLALAIDVIVKTFMVPKDIEIHFIGKMKTK
mmetsp:Transcript_28017/g.58375  ORF Transcript_28017/g.58375 Transcript_28017/m.58375 type:complete len:284 (-) Transcript_28017:1911-2762(-)